jgi:hypothetical protein
MESSLQWKIKCIKIMVCGIREGATVGKAIFTCVYTCIGKIFEKTIVPEKFKST